MPQVTVVLKCFQCNMFQAQIEKKSKKWACAICGEKQSLKRIFGTGSGKDCRLIVQQLNMKKMEEDNEEETNLMEENGDE